MRRLIRAHAIVQTKASDRSREFLRLLKEKEETMPARCDHDNGRRGCDNYARTTVGSIIVRARTSVIWVEPRAVVVAVMAVVIDVPSVTVMVIVGTRRRGRDQGDGGYQAENNFLDGFHIAHSDSRRHSSPRRSMVRL